MEEKNFEETLVNEEHIVEKPNDEDRVKRRRSYLHCLGSLIMALIVATALTIINRETPTEASPIENPEEIIETAAVETPTIEPPTIITIPETTVKDIWEERREEYPIATEVWLYMKNEFGWSDIVCAGIMGNLMRETGGDTFYLKPETNTNMGLGLVQWTGQRKEDVLNKYGRTPSIAEQLEFIKDELYGTNGVRQQVSDWQRDRIFNAKTAEKCAAEFARWFERPASTNYAKRKANATRAYKYFTEEV